jgi:hypothetical protein
VNFTILQGSDLVAVNSTVAQTIAGPVVVGDRITTNTLLTEAIIQDHFSLDEPDHIFGNVVLGIAKSQVQYNLSSLYSPQPQDTPLLATGNQMFGTTPCSLVEETTGILQLTARFANEVVKTEVVSPEQILTVLSMCENATPHVASIYFLAYLVHRYESKEENPDMNQVVNHLEDALTSKTLAHALQLDLLNEEGTKPALFASNYIVYSSDTVRVVDDLSSVSELLNAISEDPETSPPHANTSIPSDDECPGQTPFALVVFDDIDHESTPNKQTGLQFEAHTAVNQVNAFIEGEAIKSIKCASGEPGVLYLSLYIDNVAMASECTLAHSAVANALDRETSVFFLNNKVFKVVAVVPIGCSSSEHADNGAANVVHPSYIELVLTTPSALQLMVDENKTMGSTSLPAISTTSMLIIAGTTLVCLVAILGTIVWYFKREGQVWEPVIIEKEEFDQAYNSIRSPFSNQFAAFPLAVLDQEATLDYDDDETWLPGGGGSTEHHAASIHGNINAYEVPIKSAHHYAVHAKIQGLTETTDTVYNEKDVNPVAKPPRRANNPSRGLPPPTYQAPNSWRPQVHLNQPRHQSSSSDPTMFLEDEAGFPFGSDGVNDFHSDTAGGATATNLLSEDITFDFQRRRSNLSGRFAGDDNQWSNAMALNVSDGNTSEKEGRGWSGAAQARATAMEALVPESPTSELIRKQGSGLSSSGLSGFRKKKEDLKMMHVLEEIDVSSDDNASDEGGQNQLEAVV